MRRLVLVLMGIIAFEGLVSCAAVQPWQREDLADETMQFDPDLLKAAWHLHVQEVLEGGRGGFSGAGGGCGCR